MCTGLEIGALAASAAGTGLGIHSQQKAAADQAKAAGDRAERARDFNRQAGSRVAQSIDEVKKSTSEPEQKATENEYIAALRRANAADSGVSEPQGAVSQQYANDSATAKTASGVADRGAARSLAAVDAPFLQRVREGVSRGRTATDLSLLNNRAQGQDFLQQLRASLIHPDAGEAALGSFLTAGGQAFASRAKPVKPGYSGLPRTVDSTIPGGG